MTSQELRRLRRAKGWTQAELARHANVHSVTVSRLETDRHQPDLDTLTKLAKALGVPVAALLHPNHHAA